MNTLTSLIVEKLYAIPGIVVAISIHEYGHAKAAQLCGDTTGEYQGRVSLDPRAHIDPWGLLMLFIVGFGWGRPVMIDPRQFKNPRRDQIIVGLAGVFNNLLGAIAFSIICGLCLRFGLRFFVTSSIGSIIYDILSYVIMINVSLMIFNLLPIPPLDGFGVVCGIFNLYNSKFYYYAKRYGMIILVVLLYMGATGVILTPIRNAIFRLLSKLIYLIAGL